MVAGRHHAGGHPGPGGMWRGSDANGHPGAHRDECNQDDPRRTAGKFVGGGGGGGATGAAPSRSPTSSTGCSPSFRSTPGGR